MSEVQVFSPCKCASKLVKALKMTDELNDAVSNKEESTITNLAEEIGPLKDEAAVSCGLPVNPGLDRRIAAVREEAGKGVHGYNERLVQILDDTMGELTLGIRDAVEHGCKIEPNHQVQHLAEEVPAAFEQVTKGLDAASLSIHALNVLKDPQLAEHNRSTIDDAVDKLETLNPEIKKHWDEFALQELQEETPSGKPEHEP